LNKRREKGSASWLSNVPRRRGASCIPKKSRNFPLSAEGRSGDIGEGEPCLYSDIRVPKKENSGGKNGRVCEDRSPNFKGREIGDTVERTKSGEKGKGKVTLRPDREGSKKITLFSRERLERKRGSLG